MPKVLPNFVPPRVPSGEAKENIPQGSQEKGVNKQVKRSSIPTRVTPSTSPTLSTTTGSIVNNKKLERASGKCVAAQSPRRPLTPLQSRAGGVRGATATIKPRTSTSGGGGGENVMVGKALTPPIKKEVGKGGGGANDLKPSPRIKKMVKSSPTLLKTSSSPSIIPNSGTTTAKTPTNTAARNSKRSSITSTTTSTPLSGANGSTKRSARASSSPILPPKSLTNLNKKRKLVEKGVQTEDEEDIVTLLTSDEGSLQYWKQVAEERRLALEETCLENQALCERVEALEEKNRELEEIVTSATGLASMVEKLTQEAADESGIGHEEESFSAQE